MRHSPLLPDSSNLAGPLGLWETVDEALDALNTAEHAAPDRAKGALAAIAAVLNLVQVCDALSYERRFLTCCPSEIYTKRRQTVWPR